jgi:hypothetical protein
MKISLIANPMLGPGRQGNLAANRFSGLLSLPL